MNLSITYYTKPLFLFCLLALTATTSVYADSATSDGLNSAGKQRMLTQRMLKNYAMVGMNNEYNNPDKTLQEDIKHFERSLTSLKAMQISTAVNKSLTNNEQLWQPVKQVIQAKPEMNKVEKLQQDLDVLLASCHTTTELIAQSVAGKESEIVNISGRQRMLSQRLAALYMLQVWGVKDPEFKDKLHKSMDEFSDAQNILLQSSLNTEEINSRLAKVKKLFKWFEIMGRSQSERYVPAIISKTSDKIMAEMNTITNIYIKTL